MKFNPILINMLLFSFTLGTIDLTLSELQYLANHMTKGECHKLIASLHFDSFKINQNVENAEDAVPDDVNCLKLLVQWNSSPQEGRGETHEKLSLRLRQMGRNDLAEWLDSAVTRELSAVINETTQKLSGESQQAIQDFGFAQDFDAVIVENYSSWDVAQAVLFFFFVVTASIIIFLFINRIVQSSRRSKTNLQEEMEVRKLGTKLYRKISQ